MVSDINASRPPDEAKANTAQVRDSLAREASSAHDEAQKAKNTVADEATRLASSAREKAYEGVESGKNYAAGSLTDFTAAIKKASDELGERDQSMAANLVREAASGLEQVSVAIEGKSVQQLTRSVADFARRQPAAFLIGAALAGVAIGRFAKASSEHSESDYATSGSTARESYGAGSYNRDRSSSYGGGSTTSGATYGVSTTSDDRPSGAGSTSTSGTATAESDASSSSGSSAGSTYAGPLGESGTPSREKVGETTRPDSVSSPGAPPTPMPPTSQGSSTLSKGGNNES